MATTKAMSSSYRYPQGLLQVAAVLLLAAAVTFCPIEVGACSFESVTVGEVLNGLENPTFNADGSYARYSKDQVDAHFESQPPPLIRNNTRTTFSCVDARGDGQLFGTPGGDLAEIVAAAMAWFKMEQKPVNKADIAAIFNAFVTNIARPSRPIYFHTDDNRLRILFNMLSDAGVVSPKPSILPDVAPVNAEQWLQYMVKPEVQGCGHVRLMLSPETAKYYSIKLSGSEVVSCVNVTDAADCINSTEVASEVIRQFFGYWWNTKVTDPKRKNVKYVVDLGPLVGKAVAIVTPTVTTGSCANTSPLFMPNFGGSTLFVYHDQAVKEYRSFATRAARLPAVTTPLKRGQLKSLWDAVAGVQLGATLTYLPPANNIGLYAVSVVTKA